MQLNTVIQSSSFPVSKTDFVRVFSTLIYILTSYKGNEIFSCLKAIYSGKEKNMNVESFYQWKSFKNLLWELDLKECESLFEKMLKNVTTERIFNVKFCGYSWLCERISIIRIIQTLTCGKIKIIFRYLLFSRSDTISEVRCYLGNWILQINNNTELLGWVSGAEF